MKNKNEQRLVLQIIFTNIKIYQLLKSHIDKEKFDKYYIYNNHVLIMFQTTDLTKFQNRTDASIRVLAILEAKSGKGRELMDILLELVKPTRDEEGNIAYVPHRAIDNPDKILFDEVWDSRASLDNHFKMPHMKDLFSRIGDILAKPLDIQIYQEVFID